MSASRYLFPADYMADPAVHVFDGKLYIYPSHDREGGIPENDNGDHFDMVDYHVLSIDGDPMTAPVTDHGVILSVKDIPWAGRQLWDSDVAYRDGRYYLYFSLKDRNDIFRIGVAIADKPTGPFIPQPDPIRGSYSIDPAVFKNEEDGAYYMYFGGLWGGQLQRYLGNKHMECPFLPEGEDSALESRVVRLTKDMLQFDGEPLAVKILGKTGSPLLAEDPNRFFEASWMHRYGDTYYFSYSTGDTHQICYAISNNPCGPFVYKGVILTPVVGWTTHHSIVEYRNQWYLFYHDCVPSGGKTWLRSLKVTPLHHLPDGSIQTISGTDTCG